MTKIVCKLLVAAAFLYSLGLIWAQDSGAAADNTKMNQHDSQTADQQKNDPADLEMTRQIRKAIVHDKSLSTNGHNVKIITQQGIVTLKGPVKNEEEKMAIEKKAAEVAGSLDKIHSELEVAGDMSGKPSPNPDHQ